MTHIENRSTLSGVAALLLALMFLSSCLTAELEKQAEQIKQQDEEIARQRKEIEAIKAGQKAQEQKQRDCNRAFREYFDKAQTSADRERAVTLYRSGLALCPDDEIAHYELGKMLAERGRYAEAEKEFEATLKINPGFIEAKRELEAVRKSK
ncbi:MAG: tetratricopeptide repeat protein [Deltaproteobacteria bacterium]|nr:tetratricopeptide repeat protein [Deltaproteobacteria bacterium]MBI2181689.1 tetratricopeptide repeat protein [Deltaproteobacteria bacterium]MBI2231482.1 tetratricopeptide repeat protein [Deltaproteobacteria bacterium]MBI2363945.1 tetratricopeptide repeat protein [Deltaproteobacteria bacterium]MBI2531692.1 tetratricopeptide repeat protein [Deltaproteobacteria bacterium]